ncbi:beta 1-4 rhamnosyltransferase Cps2T [Candidatus Clostridium stratigraminis]|uniref:Beta 1-4 rhamnosyltransferase Cps2T n=1 Tax=Candidatus Clostridium stratigraminis TaxID=3381661 RepID=A0ABW8T2R1_9CLOT
MEVFIIGSKGIPARYGGFETFVHNLTAKKKSENIKYNVSCLGTDNNEFEFNNARCFNVKVKNIGSIKAIIYDITALRECIKYIRKNKLKNSIVYILACRIGFFLAIYCKVITKMGIKIFVNPDGHEWKRSKWNKVIKAYWKWSERLSIKYADLIICDSKEIEKYINKKYEKFKPKTKYIPYGAEIKYSSLSSNLEKFLLWLKENYLKANEYYLIVGRFVPENNYELIISEFMKTNTRRKLIIITNVEKNKFYEDLMKRTRFDEDRRIKFVGTVYDEKLLTDIRENAYAYLHGHEVGGTNPSLLEALANTNINILLDVAFNKEVGEDAGLYFSKERDDLANLINKVDKYNYEKINSLGNLAKSRIKEQYSWKAVVDSYEKLFLNSLEE